MGLPGVVLAILMLRPMGSKRLQGWGFVAIAAASLCFAAALYAAAGKWTSFALTCVLVFVINWGVNVSTYVLPAQAFPTAVRSSFFGCSAGLGKLGALLGTYTFGPIAHSGEHGVAWVFVACAAVSLLGLGVTHRCVEPYGRDTLFGHRGLDRGRAVSTPTARDRAGNAEPLSLSEPLSEVPSSAPPQAC